MTADDSAHEVYEAWAPTYEQDLIEGYGYNAHRIGAHALAEAGVDRSSAVIDMGCGTGLVAQCLRDEGFSCIDGADASPEMLQVAKSKGVYRNLLHVDLTAPDALAPKTYAAGVAVGVFGGGHIGPQHLACFAGPIQPGGLIALFANGIPFIEDNYAEHLRTLESNGLWTIERMDCVNYMGKIERPGWLVVLRMPGKS